MSLSNTFANRFTQAICLLWLIVLISLAVPLLLGLGDAPDVPPTIQPNVGRFVQLSLNSAWVAGLGSVISLLWAIIAGHALVRGPKGISRVLTPLALLPVFVSSPVIAVASIRLFGPVGIFSKILFGNTHTFPVSESIRGIGSSLPAAPLYSLTGCGMVLAWALSPLALMICMAGFRSNSPDVEDAAALDSGQLQRFLRVILPLLAPVFALAGAVVFLFGFLEFGIPESLRSQPVLVAEIYLQAAVFYNTSGATLTGLVALGLIVGPMIALFRWATRHETEERVQADQSGKLSLLQAAPGFVLAVLPSVMLVGSLLLTATGPHGQVELWKTVLETAREEIIKSYLLSAFASVLIVACGFVLASGFFFVRSKTVLYALLIPPFVVPSTLLAISLLVLVRLPGGSIGDALFWFSQTHGPLVLLWIVRFSPLVALLLIAHWRQLFNAEVQDSMKLDSASPLTAMRDFFWPTSRGPLVLCLLLAFALSMGEVGAAVLLMPPGITNVSVRLLTLMHYAPDGQVSALCLILIAPVLLGAFVLAFFPTRWYKQEPSKEQASSK